MRSYLIKVVEYLIVIIIMPYLEFLLILKKKQTVSHKSSLWQSVSSLWDTQPWSWDVGWWKRCFLSNMATVEPVKFRFPFVRRCEQSWKAVIPKTWILFHLEGEGEETVSPSSWHNVLNDDFWIPDEEDMCEWRRYTLWRPNIWLHKRGVWRLVIQHLLRR